MKQQRSLLKGKLTQMGLVITVACFLILNVVLIFMNQQQKGQLHDTKEEVKSLADQKEHAEFMFEIFKSSIQRGFEYNGQNIVESAIYYGSDSKTLIPLRSITDQPKLVIGLNQNMCAPCVESAFAEIEAIFPDFESNPNIICIADIEERFKNDYYGKKVVSFVQEEAYPLYALKAMPYFFILDKDLCVKLLFVTDNTAPELVKEYLKIIKKRYPRI
jgi:hypothetical protein